MTRDQAKKGVRVRDGIAGRVGVIVSLDTLAMGLVAVAMDPCGQTGGCTVWCELEDLERVRDSREAPSG